MSSTVDNHAYNSDAPGNSPHKLMLPNPGSSYHSNWTELKWNEFNLIIFINSKVCSTDFRGNQFPLCRGLRQQHYADVNNMQTVHVSATLYMVTVTFLLFSVSNSAAYILCFYFLVFLQVNKLTN